MNNETPTFGMMIRALRIGFGWTGRSFLRVSGSGPFKFEFRPMELIPNTERNHEPHRAWWEQGADHMLDVPIFQVRAKRHFIVWVGDDGMPA